MKQAKEYANEKEDPIPLYAYMDGTLMYSKVNVDGGFAFTAFLGCSYGGNNPNFNAVGEIDYIRIATLPK